MHKYVRLNRAARVCVCVRADVCAVCSFVDARVQVGVCGTFDMSRDFVTTSGPDKKHKQQQHPRHHSAATDGTRRGGRRWSEMATRPLGSCRHRQSRFVFPNRLVYCRSLCLSLSRARALTFSLSAGGLSTLGVFLSGFFPAQHTDCEDHPKIIRSCERVHRPTVTATSAADTPTMPTTPTTTPPTTTSPLVRIIYARMRPL